MEVGKDMDLRYGYTLGEVPTLPGRPSPGFSRPGGRQNDRTVFIVGVVLPQAFLGLDSSAVLGNPMFSLGTALVLLACFLVAIGTAQPARRLSSALLSGPSAHGRLIASAAGRGRGLQPTEATGSPRWVGRPSTPRLWGSC